MTDKRGVSQVQFSLLPEQTVDIRNGIWRVNRWPEARLVPVDTDVVRKELKRAVYPWAIAKRDNGLFDQLVSGADIQVAGVSERGGVEVERFPQVFRCKSCGRIRLKQEGACDCGKRAWAQVPFVAYHDCGYLGNPWIPKCPTHEQVRAEYARTATARDIRFECPVCKALISQGFRFIRCDCGGGTLKYQIHRASAVYVPRSAVIVNPPNEEIARQYRSEGASARALSWALGGFSARTPLEGAPTIESLVANLVAQKIPEEMATVMAAAAAAAAPEAVQSSVTTDTADIPPAELDEARDAAVHLAYAMAGGRVTVEDLGRQYGGGAQGVRYGRLYPPAIAGSGLQAVELLPSFPVLTAAFGFTRGDPRPGASTLVPFMGEGGAIRLHGYRAETEALMFRLKPAVVAKWLGSRGFELVASGDDVGFRKEVIKQAAIPGPGDVLHTPTVGGEILKLVHSFSHRVIRRIAAFAGVDRESLSEYLAPLHLAFIVYASTRGDFVLGGLQALFEHDLDAALRDCVLGESRCALDPGCASEGGACVACLHVGEPSCRYYNQYLDRRSLFGPGGYFANV